MTNEGRFETFLRGTNEFSIEIPALPRPTLAQLQAKNSWIRRIERDTSSEGPVVLDLVTILRDEVEDLIDGPEYERRIASSLSQLLGYQQLAWLIEHQDEFPVFVDLLGKIYVDFPALVVVSKFGRRSVPYGDKNGKRWGLGWDGLDSRFGRNSRMARMAEQDL